jgi:hypothetical protein
MGARQTSVNVTAPFLNQTSRDASAVPIAVFQSRSHVGMQARRRCIKIISRTCCECKPLADAGELVALWPVHPALCTQRRFRDHASDMIRDDGADMSSVVSEGMLS